MAMTILKTRWILTTKSVEVLTGIETALPKTKSMATGSLAGLTKNMNGEVHGKTSETI